MKLINIMCPTCGKAGNVEDRLEGSVIPCQGCGLNFIASPTNPVPPKPQTAPRPAAPASGHAYPTGATTQMVPTPAGPTSAKPVAPPIPAAIASSVIPDRKVYIERLVLRSFGYLFLAAGIVSMFDKPYSGLPPLSRDIRDLTSMMMIVVSLAGLMASARR